MRNYKEELNLNKTKGEKRSKSIEKRSRKERPIKIDKAI